MAATKTTTTKKASTKKASKKAGAKGAAPKAADRAATAAPATEAPTTAPAAQEPARAGDGAKGGKPAAKVPAAPKVEILTEDEAKARGGMTEIIKTLKGRDPAMRIAAKAGGFVIEHEDGRYSAAKAGAPVQEATEAAEQPEAPAKPKHSFETAPGKALDHIVKESKRRAKAKAAGEKPGAAKPAKGAKQAKAPKAPKAKKVSALDAAAQVA